jgi:hypothetical protein
MTRRPMVVSGPRELGVPAAPSGSRPSDRAANGVSPVPASIPNAAHTPGPWQAFKSSSRGGGYVIDTALGVESTNEYVIADRVIGAQADGNARLIAAAPELYEALDALLSLDSPNRQYVYGHPAAQQALAALAKARGEVSQ